MKGEVIMRGNTIFLVEEDVSYIKEFCKFFKDEYTILCSETATEPWILMRT